jgi:hypothetical protein
MVGSTDIVIVSLIAIGAAVLVGILGYLIDKSDEHAQHKRERNGG